MISQWKLALERTVLRKPLIILALILVGLFGIAVDAQNRRAALQVLRSDVRDQAGIIRAKLEGNINSDIHLVRGLASTISTEPDMDQARFARLAGLLLNTTTQLRNVAGAPDMVISLMHPIKGNEKAIGLDYRTNPSQREVVFDVLRTRKPAIAGPVNLVQGGQGFIGRFPVYHGEEPWGIVSAVIDVEKLYRASGLLDDGLGIDVALIGSDAAGESGKQFFGRSKVDMSEPIKMDVKLPNGSWRLLAVPKDGWDAIPATVWYQRGFLILSGVLLLIPILFASRLSDQRKNIIGDLGEREAKLRRLTRRHELALDASQFGVWDLNLDSRRLVWDDKMRELYGLEPGKTEVTVDDWRNSLHRDDLVRAEQEFEEAISSKGKYRSNFRIVLSNGKVRHIRTIGAVYQDSNGGWSLVGVNWDVTEDINLQNELRRAKVQMESRNAELEQTRSHIEHMAMHDSLTGLPNRRYLENELSQFNASPDLPKGRVALIIVDLDRFKQINDAFGHDAGDKLLVHVSKVLTSVIKAGDFVARIGGDEFVIFCRSFDGRDDLGWLAEQITDSMAKPVTYKGNECRFGVSIGIAESYGVSHSSVRDLLKNADLALYEAKNTGRNKFEFFTEKLELNSIRQKVLADDILGGIERGEFVPYYQPQYDSRRGKLVGVEALARWNHPRHGVLSPDKFLDVAEEIKVTASIDREILRYSVKDLANWTASGLEVPKVSVNVSAHRLLDRELLDCLRSLPICPGTLAFELVESIFLDDGDEAIVKNIERIKDLGIEIEIDDFGTGHTSIISLLKLNPSRLKIDKQFILPITDSEFARNLAQSIIDIGKSLDIGVIAEGVETEEHARILRELGCDTVQGYGFGRPMAASEIMSHFGQSKKMTA